MKKITRRSILAAAPSALAFAAPFLSIAQARAEKQYGPGVTDTEIKLGNTVPYSGPTDADRTAWNLGQRMGLEGRASLWPLVLFVGLVGVWLVRNVRRSAASRSAPPRVF